MRLNDPSRILTWPKPNYVNPVTRGPELYIVTGIFLVLATTALSFRLYARLFRRRWSGADDVLMAIGCVSRAPGPKANVLTRMQMSNFCVEACVLWANVHYAWDRHFWDANPKIFPGE
jgi:hypothetical protein